MGNVCGVVPSINCLLTVYLTAEVPALQKLKNDTDDIVKTVNADLKTIKESEPTVTNIINKVLMILSIILFILILVIIIVFLYIEDKRFKEKKSVTTAYYPSSISKKKKWL